MLVIQELHPRDGVVEEVVSVRMWFKVPLHVGDSGASPEGWGGRGGGRFRPQPRISSALGMAVQRGVVNLQQSRQQSDRLSVWGLPRTLVDPAGAYVFSLRSTESSLRTFKIVRGSKAAQRFLRSKRCESRNPQTSRSGDVGQSGSQLWCHNDSAIGIREAVLNDGLSGAKSFPSMGSGGQSQPKRFNGSIVIRNNAFVKFFDITMNAWVVFGRDPARFDTFLVISKWKLHTMELRLYTENAKYFRIYRNSL